MNDASERWLPVTGYEGYYEVSDRARVRSVPRRARNGRRVPGRVLRLGRHKYGYPTANLWRDNRYTTRTVHSLVAEAFIGPCSEGMEVRHRNGDTANSSLSNLTYGTHADNMQDAIRHGTNPHSAQTHCKYNHPFSDANTGTGKRGDGHTFRVCRICSRERDRAYRQRKAARGVL